MVFLGVGGGLDREALTDDDNRSSRRPIIGELISEPGCPLDTTATREVTPEQHHRRPISNQIVERHRCSHLVW